MHNVYGALEPVHSFNKTEKAYPYLRNIKTFYVIFSHNSTHFYFSIFSTYYPFLIPSFLPSNLFTFIVFLYTFPQTFGLRSYQFISEILFFQLHWINEEFYKHKTSVNNVRCDIFLVSSRRVKHFTCFINSCSLFLHSVYITQQIVR